MISSPQISPLTNLSPPPIGMIRRKQLLAVLIVIFIISYIFLNLLYYLRSIDVVFQIPKIEIIREYPDFEGANLKEWL
jgi:hypothetical protein